MAEKLTRREEQEIAATEPASELKPRGFRLDDATMERFDEITKDLGGNRQHAMAQLIAVYSAQGEKNLLKQGGDKLEAFEKYQTVQHDMFLELLKQLDDTTELVRTEFAAQLDSKDTIIMELQAQLAAMQKDLDKAKKDLEPTQLELRSKTDAFEDEKAAHENDCTAFANKEIELNQIITELKEELSKAKASDENTRKLYEENVKVIVSLQGEMDVLKRQESPLRDNLSKTVTENKILSSTNTKLEAENDSLKKDYDSLKLSRDTELELARKQGALEERAQAQKDIDKIRKEADEIRNRYMSLLEREHENANSKK